MDLFGIGGAELLLLAFFALVILGPRRLAAMAREAGKLMGQVRALTTGLTRQLNQEIEFMEAAGTGAQVTSPHDKPESGQDAGDSDPALPEAYRRFREDHPTEGQLDGLSSGAVGSGGQRVGDRRNEGLNVSDL